MKCIKCNSENVVLVKQDVYIISESITTKPLYGCKDCKSMFIVIDSEMKELTGMKKTESAMRKVSNKCLGFLENIT